MLKGKSIEFLVDDKGRKKAVLMSYKAYLELLEDIADLQAIAERKDQESVDLESEIANLKDAGRI